MKLLMVAPYFYPRGGGLENYVYNLGKTLAARHGIEVSVICSNWSREGYREEITDRMRVCRFPYLVKISTTPVNPFWSRRIAELISGDRPDMINGHLPVPYIADISARLARRMDIPFVLTCHDILAQSAIYHLVSRLYFSIMGNRTLECSSWFIVNSQQTAHAFDSLEKKYGDRITVVPPAVDVTLFRPEDIIREGERKILFVGQLFPSSKKGLDTLIRALPLISGEVKGARLLVAGPGPVTPYRKLARRLGKAESVSFLGELRPESLPRYYNLADVVVLPSRKKSEGFGMSLIEAQACGRPVVGTTVGGIPNAVIDGETGLLVPPGDPPALARVLIRLLQDGALAARLARNGLRRVTGEFTWEKSALKTLQVYEKSLKGWPTLTTCPHQECRSI